MLIEESELEKRLQGVLGYKIAGSIYCGELPAPALSPEEEKQLLLLRNERRRESFIRGRHVLKNVLSKMGRACETSVIGFPNRNLSLSHSRNCAVAVGVADNTVKGIGVDLEFMRETKDGMMRFFLTPEESEWLTALSESERNMQIIRLWTVKEALFKADMHNASLTMRDYKLVLPAVPMGKATRGVEEPYVFKYASFSVGDAWITVALSVAPGDENVS